MKRDLFNKHFILRVWNIISCGFYRYIASKVENICKKTYWKGQNSKRYDWCKVLETPKETCVTVTLRKMTILMTLTKAGNCLQKNISWLIIAEECYQRAREDKACASRLAQNTAHVNLLTFSHNSAAADVQMVWWADEINSVGHISSSALQDPLSFPTGSRRIYFGAVDRENDLPQPSRACPFYVL